MDHESYPDDYLRDILEGVRTIAVVGASPRRERPSHRVMAYLQRRGYRTIPVNPNAVGGTINGENVFASLAGVPEPVDMVDVFRRTEAAGAVADEAIAIGAKVVWMQLGVRDNAAAARAEAAGLKVVMNRCPAIEIPRLGLPIRLASAWAKAHDPLRAPFPRRPSDRQGGKIELVPVMTADDLRKGLSGVQAAIQRYGWARFADTAETPAGVAFAVAAAGSMVCAIEIRPKRLGQSRRRGWHAWEQQLAEWSVFVDRSLDKFTEMHELILLR